MSNDNLAEIIIIIAAILILAGIGMTIWNQFDSESEYVMGEL